MLHILPRPFGRQMPLCLYLSLFSAFLEHFDKREKRKSVLFSRMQLSSFVSRGHVSLALLLYIVDDVSRTLSELCSAKRERGPSPFFLPSPQKKIKHKGRSLCGGRTRRRGYGEYIKQPTQHFTLSPLRLQRLETA